jgi:GH24 family phage-related lysozyme (muramidase)
MASKEKIMPEEHSDELPISWKKIQILTGLIGAILVPTVVGIIGNTINQSIKNNEIGLSYVQLAVSILKEEPNPNTENLRKWAIAVVNNYSDVDLSEEAQQELQKERIGVTDIASEFDSLSLKVTTDPVGVQIIGYNHTLTSEELRTGKISIDGEMVDYRGGITAQQAQQLLEQDIKPFRQIVDNLVTVELTNNQLDALTSFVYRSGPSTFKNSTLLRLLNQGKYDQVPNEMRKWSRAGGRQLPELVRLREREIELWNQKD